MNGDERGMQRNDEDLQRQLTDLLTEHGDLDAAIDALQVSATSDRTQLQRLKKKKLHLKDRIAELRGKVTPDIIA